MPPTDHPPTAARPASAPGRARRAGAAFLLLLVLQPALAACYTTVPVEPATAPGSTLVLDLNDRGRVALGDSIGPSAARIEGVLATRSESSYVLRVSSVQYLNGQSNRWSGEPLSVPATLVDRARERRYSRARTYGLAAGVLAAVVAVVVSTDLFGSNGIGRSPNPPPGQNQ
jgi:hypothetical protein